MPVPGSKGGDDDLAKKAAALNKAIAKLESDKGSVDQITELKTQLAQITEQQKDGTINAESFGYETATRPDGAPRPALEELIRWRLFNRTGGGLMAELGSHQLDAAGILISALTPGGEKAL